jgi:anaphase-promoting complex subunit 5
MITDALFQVIEMKQRFDQGPSAIEPLLSALWHSEFQFRLNLYRTGIILLADVGLEFGMTKRSRRILEEIMPQVIIGTDLEQRALACFTFARCIIAAADTPTAGLPDAVRYLQIAESDYAALQCLHSLMNAQYLLSVVYHNLGLQKQRDDAAARHMATDQARKKLEVVVVDEQVTKIWEVVSQVGAALAAR